MDNLKTDELLDKIAASAGILFLSDLKKYENPEELFRIFLKEENSGYTMKEWRQAIAYIFSLAQPNLVNNFREVILWDIGEYGDYITEILKEFLNYREIPGAFHYASSTNDLHLSQEKSYLLFYHRTDQKKGQKIREEIRKACKNVCYVALCRDYGEGINSMGRGDFYALKLPLDREKIIRCYEHFGRILEKGGN